MFAPFLLRQRYIPFAEGVLADACSKKHIDVVGLQVTTFRVCTPRRAF